MPQGIITRGLGTPLLVTQGYGAIPGFIPEIIDDIRIRKGGGGGAKRRRRQEELRDLTPIVVWAKLVEVNDMPPKVTIEGSITVPGGPESDPPSTKVEYITRRVRKAWEAVKVTVKRLK
jgi:hypothetical protein